MKVGEEDIFKVCEGVIEKQSNRHVSEQEQVMREKIKLNGKRKLILVGLQLLNMRNEETYRKIVNKYEGVHMIGAMSYEALQEIGDEVKKALVKYSKS